MIYNLKTLNIWKAEDNRKNRLSKNRIKEIRGAGFTVPMYMGAQLLNVSVDDLNLSVRSSNCLKRVGFNTVGDVLNAIDSWDDLNRIKNLGKTSLIEIRDQIITYQKSLLSEPEKIAFSEKVRELNRLG